MTIKEQITAIQKELQAKDYQNRMNLEARLNEFKTIEQYRAAEEKMKKEYHYEYRILAQLKSGL